MRNKMYKCEITDKKGRKIKMNITNEAKEYIQAMLEEQQAKGLRVCGVEEGHCGLQVGSSVALLEKANIVSDINENSVAIATQAKGNISVLTYELERKDEESVIDRICAQNDGFPTETASKIIQSK